LIRAADVAVQRYALPDALAILAEALARSEDLPEGERDRRQLELILRRAFILSLQGHQQEILSILRNRATLVHRVADPALSSDYFARLGLVHWYRGEHQQSDVVATEALRTGEQAGSAEHMGRAEYVLALNCAGLGLPDKGIAHGMRAVAHFDAPRTRHWRGLAHFGLALNQVIAGLLDDALKSAGRCVEIGEAEHDSRLTSGGRYIIAWTHVHLGDFEVAMEMAGRTLEAAKDAVAICLANGVYGRAAMEKGDALVAVSHLRESVDRLRAMPLRLTEARFLALLSEAYLRTGDLQQAVVSAERAEALSREDGNPFTRALAKRALGRIAVARNEMMRAQKLLTQALSGFEQVGTRIEAAQTQIDLAEILKQAGAAPEAHEHLRAAAQRLEAAGAFRRAAETRELVVTG
jgi:tetratricopeptide (TPR) repeat protein